MSDVEKQMYNEWPCFSPYFTRQPLWEPLLLIHQPSIFLRLNKYGYVHKCLPRQPLYLIRYNHSLERASLSPHLPLHQFQRLRSHHLQLPCTCHYQLSYRGQMLFLVFASFLSPPLSYASPMRRGSLLIGAKPEPIAKAHASVLENWKIQIKPLCAILNSAKNASVYPRYSFIAIGIPIARRERCVQSTRNHKVKFASAVLSSRKKHATLPQLENILSNDVGVRRIVLGCNGILFKTNAHSCERS